MRVIRAGKKRSGTTTAGGQQRGSVYLGEQKVQVDVPRVHNLQAGNEVKLTSYEKLQTPTELDEKLLLKVLYGLSSM